MRGLPSILSLFRSELNKVNNAGARMYEFNKFNNAGARMLDSI